jgi:hypothetical protein
VETLGDPLPVDHTTERVEEKAIYAVGSVGEGSFGMSARILDMVSFGVLGSTDRYLSHQYEIERVIEKTFFPTADYVRNSVFQEKVLKQLESKLLRQPLYMIVGVRIAFNTKITHEQRSKRVGELKAGGGFSPASVELQARTERKEGLFEQKHISSGFIFAYRMRKVRYSRSSRSAAAREYDKGQLFTLRDSDTNDSTYPSHLRENAEPKEQITSVKLEEFDYEEDEEDTRIVDGCIIVGNGLNQGLA